MSAPAASSEALVTVEDLHTYYGKSHILHGVSLEVGRGEVVGLLGRNGVGKSTTLKAIAGLVHPSAGEVTFEGRSIGRLQSHTVARLGIAYVPEERRIFPLLTVLENLRTGLDRMGVDKAKRARLLDKVYAYFPILAERRNQAGGTLSGGEQQMLAIARALMSRPKLLLLDEPSLGLAPIVCHTIFTTIDEIKATGTTVLLVEQNANAALKHSDRGYVLETGAVTLEGSAATIAGDPRIREAYLGE